MFPLAFSPCRVHDKPKLLLSCLCFILYTRIEILAVLVINNRKFEICDLICKHMPNKFELPYLLVLICCR